MDAARTRVTAGGRVVLPARFRESLGLQIGDEVIIELGDGELRLIPSSVALRRAQELVERYAGGTRSLADELLVERRREASRA